MEQNEIYRVRQIALSLGNGSYASNLSVNSKDALLKLVERHDALYRLVKELQDYNGVLQQRVHDQIWLDKQQQEAFAIMQKIKAWIA